MLTILYFILALIALGVLVFIHELGHYLVALKMGMKVEIFSIGFGKPILKWKWKGVDWQLAALPFGGFVKIAGMEFGKKENNVPVDPYKVEGGFFQMSPWKRIAVAIAGPFANFLLALILLTLLFVMGGRQKPFSEFSHTIGWVDPRSELSTLGVKPGDLLTEYDGKPYTSSKDLLYAAVQGERKVGVKGFHIDYATGEKTPFSYVVQNYPAPGALDDVYSTGIQSTATYLIYDTAGGQPNPLPEGSPMASSGIQYGDRLVWMDGELLFSESQLGHLLNDGKTFLTVKRGKTLFHTRQKRYLAGDLLLSHEMKNELLDWQYAGNVKGKWQQLYLLPYDLTADGTIEGPLSLVEGNREPMDDLVKGDQIVAVGGISVHSAHEILNALQNQRVNLIVERGVSRQKSENASEADALFERSFDIPALQAITQTVGEPSEVHASGKYVLLNPVLPKSQCDFIRSPEAKEAAQKHYDEQLKKISEVRKREKRERLLEMLQESQCRTILGIALQDKTVKYNPNPLSLFATIFRETWWTLKALVSGYLNPKFLAGPIGIVQVIQHGWRVGLGEAIFWISAISINLGFINLLPLPILDGGYICLSLWELITRRKLKVRTMERLIVPFVVLLIGLLIFLTFQDISRFF